MGCNRGLAHGLVVALALSLLGCASAPPVKGFEPSSQLPVDVELSHIAFYPQTQDQCGPAALATVLEHAGVVRTLQQLEADVYVPQRQGSLQLEMLGGARRAGVLPYLSCRESCKRYGKRWRQAIPSWCCKTCAGIGGLCGTMQWWSGTTKWQAR